MKFQELSFSKAWYTKDITYFFYMISIVKLIFSILKHLLDQI